MDDSELEARIEELKAEYENAVEEGEKYRIHTKIDVFNRIKNDSLVIGKTPRDTLQKLKTVSGEDMYGLRAAKIDALEEYLSKNDRDSGGTDE